MDFQGARGFACGRSRILQAFSKRACSSQAVRPQAVTPILTTNRRSNQIRWSSCAMHFSGKILA